MRTEYVILNYSDLSQNGEPKTKIVSQEEMFKIIDRAKDNKDKIVVFSLGTCLLDWS